MKSRSRTPLLAIAILAMALAVSQARTWTDAASGRTIEAEFVGLEGDEVKLKLSTGKITSVPLSRLVEADQAFAKEQSAPASAGASISGGGADWPQWRGPDRTNISPDTGLMGSWPSDGPKLLWTYENAGNGYSSCSIAGGRYYTLGARDQQEILICLDASTGEEVWTANVEQDPEEGYNTGWGAGPRSTPTVSGDHIYVLGVAGDLVCFATDGGKEIWRKNLVSDFGGQISKWGYSESPTVDGEQVVVTPGGDQGAIVALDRNTGGTLWQSKDLTDRAEYSSLVPAEIGGKRQYIQLFTNTLAGVDAGSGKVLWTSEWEPGKVAVIPTPVVRGEHVYITSGYNAGAKLVKVSGDNAEDIWQNDEMICHHGGVVLVGDHIYGFTDQKKGNLMCQDFMTGKVAWMEREDRVLMKGAVHCADGMLYCFNEGDGTVTLVEANPRSFSKKGQFQLPKTSEIRADKGKFWSHPVVIGGKLYLRDQDLVFCYDVKG